MKRLNVQWHPTAVMRPWRQLTTHFLPRSGINDLVPLAAANRCTNKLPLILLIACLDLARIASAQGVAPQPGFTTPADPKFELLLSEPEVRQPVHLSFDERGRLWVVQYLQYPAPAGLKVLSHDAYWRAQYDKVPQPPPHHVRGADKITIHEDTDVRVRGAKKYDCFYLCAKVHHLIDSSYVACTDYSILNEGALPSAANSTAIRPKVSQRQRNFYPISWPMLFLEGLIPYSLQRRRMKCPSKR